jgi:hypothetical protein
MGAKRTVRSRPNCGRQPLEEMQPNRLNHQNPPFAAFVGQLYMLMCASHATVKWISSNGRKHGYKLFIEMP